jgi:DNA (cytosine-5)-methyltransferase 1
MKKQKIEFSFIDLYAGIGGIRFAFEAAGGKCIFSSEWDKYAQLTYEAFHGNKPEVGDITPVVERLEVDRSVIPTHNILTAGFPCQPFSLAGVSKKQSLGRNHGFEDPTQGTEFFKVKEILRIKQPEAFLLENVKNLKSHDEGRTFRVIEGELDKVGYHFRSRIINAAGWVPQHRERIYFIGIRKDFELEEYIEDIFPDPPLNRIYDLSEVIDSQNEVDPKYTIGPGTWETLKRHKAFHMSIGQGFGYGLITPPFEGKTTRTISARYHKDGAEILVDQGPNKRPRKLTPLEACKIQGFPKKCYKYFNGDARLPVSDTQIYRQFGNSVAVPVIMSIANDLIKFLLLKNVIGNLH